MKKILILLVVILSFSCEDSTQKQYNPCSAENPTGDCNRGFTCLEGTCIDIYDLCSPDNHYGACKTGFECYQGECVEITDLCSPEFPEGVCDDGLVCFEGECIDENGLCSPQNVIGLCPTGTVCIDGVCQSDIDECSLEFPDGYCENGKQCLRGYCVDPAILCSETNPNGLCEEGFLCVSGVCEEVQCQDGDVKNCYPSNRDEIGKGFCRMGVQFCENSAWGECENAILPEEEVCDGIDNNCNGEIDEGELNQCGICGELPEEIVGNNIDDDCDGFIDEDEEHPFGSDDCDGRENQPCYTGPVGTAGKGICEGGTRDCQPDGRWGACQNQVLPEQEICGDLLDNDCDGYIDEDCSTQECLEEEICGNHKDDNCNELIDEGCRDSIEREECIDEEICNDGLDNNCDGEIDESCNCTGTIEIDCYHGDPSNLEHPDSICRAGTVACVGGENWGECIGEVLPEYEICDGIDNDCDGEIDEGALDANSCGVCGEPTPEEICHDGIDNDCDGDIDENCPVSCIAEPEICDGSDNDCDGLIDEGVVNSCGLCNESCYSVEQSGRDDFMRGIGDGVSNNSDPDILTLDSAAIQNNYIWIANSEDNTVHRINTVSGEKAGPFPVEEDPSRTAVEQDGSVWVANRKGHSVTRLGVDGSFKFRVQLDQNCEPRGIALDKDGNAWVGCMSWSAEGDLVDLPANGYVYKISPLGLIQNGYPYETGIGVYGFAIDSRGYIWNSSVGPVVGYSDKIFKIDTNKDPDDEGFFKSYGIDFSTYGMVVDIDDNIWYAGWTQNDIKKVVYNEESDTISVESYSAPSENNLLHARGIAVDKDGNIWCAFSGSNKLAKFSSSGEFLGAYHSGAHPIGVGVDSEGQIWVMNMNENSAVEFNPQGTIMRTVEVGSKPYTYSDMTGFNLRHIVSRMGTFRLIFDTLREEQDSIYDSIEWEGETPNGAKVMARIRVAQERTTFALSDTDPSAPKWSNWVENSGDTITWPDDVTNKIGRYAQIELKLVIGVNNEDLPTVTSVKINWQRP